jgi:hypothetical protein
MEGVGGWGMGGGGVDRDWEQGRHGARNTGK